MQLAGAAALSFGDAEDNPVLEPLPGQTPLWPTVVLRALFPIATDLRPLCAVLLDACAPRALAVAPVEDARWQNGARIAPRPIGERLLVSPADAADAAPGKRAHVKLRMGLAFGTGEHPTTALCLEWLEANVRPGQRILDYGCGSGVLALAALALGADHAWAVDNDPQALTATAENARLNGVGDRLWIGLPSDLPPVTVDVIVANILADPLERLAPVFRSLLAANGVAVLSGILEHQAPAVRKAYARHFEQLFSSERRGWIRLEARTGHATRERLESSPSHHP